MRKQKKVKLSTVLKLKEYVENEINSKYDSIAKYNKGGMNIASFFDDIDFYETELIKLKEKIRDANGGKHSDGHTNDYYIYLLFNVNKRIHFYRKLDVTDTTSITVDEVNKRLSRLQDEAERIRNKLTKFNDTTKVSLDLSDERLKRLI